MKRIVRALKFRLILILSYYAFIWFMDIIFIVISVFSIRLSYGEELYLSIGEREHPQAGSSAIKFALHVPDMCP